MTAASQHKSEVYLKMGRFSVNSRKEAKYKTLNALFRFYSFTNDLRINDCLFQEDLKILADITGVPLDETTQIVNYFLFNLKIINMYYENNPISYNSDLSCLRKKIRIYMHKIHRLAPVFDYKRAKMNLNILHNVLEKKLFWPKISTQVAIVIYVTDKKKSDYISEKCLIQKNLRALSNCSAYAFHRTRNVLGIK